MIYNSIVPVRKVSPEECAGPYQAFAS